MVKWGEWLGSGTRQGVPWCASLWGCGRPRQREWTLEADVAESREEGREGGQVEGRRGSSGGKGGSKERTAVAAGQVKRGGGGGG